MTTLPVVLGAGQLIVGVDRRGLARAVEAALGRIDVGVVDGGAQIVDVEAIGGERLRVELNAHGGPLPPLMLTSPTPGCCEIFCASRVSADVFELDQGEDLRRDREGHDRRVGRIDLGVDRRRRQIGRQQIVRRVDGGLHLLFGDVEAEVQAELQRDDGGSGRTRRGHLVEARHLAELALERRRHRGGHDFGTGAGKEGLHLDRRIIDLGQRRQAAETDKRRRRRAESPAIRSDVATGRRMNSLRGVHASPGSSAGALRAAHWRRLPRPMRDRRDDSAAGLCSAAVAFRRLAGASSRRIGGGPAGMKIFAPSRRRSAPSMTTRSPGASPEVTATMAVVRRSKLDRTHGDRVVGADQIDVGSGRAALDRGRRRSHDAAQRFDQQPRIDELIGKELVVEVVEFGAQLHHAGRRVDLIVERQRLCRPRVC